MQLGISKVVYYVVSGKQTVCSSCKERVGGEQWKGKFIVKFNNEKVNNPNYLRNNH